MLHKRIVLAVVSLLIMTIGLGVASAQIAEVEIPDALPADGITITYWHEWSNAQQTAIEQLVATFNETNEWNITVEPVFIGQVSAVADQISTGILSGELPNLTGAVFSDTARSYYQEGILVPLDLYYNDPTWGFSDEEKADLNQQLLDVNRLQGEPYNGQLLSWPIGLSANVLSVNMDMMRELGYDGPPTDLATFRDAACGATELTSASGGDVQGFPIRLDAWDLYSFIVSQGGAVFDEATQTYNLTDDAAVETVTFFQNLYNDGCAYIPDGPFVNTADFAFGLNPMAVGSSVGVPFIKNDIVNSASGIEEWVNTTVPYAGDGPTLQVFLRSIGMIASTPEEQLATWLFIKYLASTEAQITWTELTQYQPYTFSGLEGLSEEFLAENPQFSNLRDILLDPNVTLWSSPGHLGGRDVTDAVASALSDILTGGADVASRLAEVEAEANEIVADNM